VRPVHAHDLIAEDVAVLYGHEFDQHARVDREDRAVRQRSVLNTSLRSLVLKIDSKKPSTLAPVPQKSGSVKVSEWNACSGVAAEAAVGVTAATMPIATALTKGLAGRSSGATRFRGGGPDACRLTKLALASAHRRKG
jgi:hypothetical protein